MSVIPATSGPAANAADGSSTVAVEVLHLRKA